MDTKTATPTPWSYEPCADTDGRTYAIKGSDSKTFFVAETYDYRDVNLLNRSETNAALIVQCVNSHQELVAALESSRNLLADLGHQDTKYFPTFQSICTALTLAKGEQP